MKIDHLKLAKKMLANLVNHLKNFEGGEKSLTYGGLATKMNYPEPHIGSCFANNIGKTLGKMGHMFDDITIDGEEIPLIQSLVVNANTKLPSDGLREFYKNYPILSKNKKRDFVNNEYQRIFKFGDRWEKLLDKLKIKPINGKEIKPRSKKGGLYNPYGSEGSPEHIKLRDYIKNNPSAIGLEANLKGIVEHPLKSGDKLDVVFKNEDLIIGIEVKSRRSGWDDIERGMFQCVKYASVLSAEQKVIGNNKIVKCYLVLENKLPKKLSIIKKILDIKIYEDQKPL